MITVYGEGRGFRVVWLLEEMGLPYRLRPVDMLAGPENDAEFVAINPAVFIPALRDGDMTMVESIAIMEYLMGRHGPTPLAVAPQEAAFGAYQQFLHLGEAGLAMPMFITVVANMLAPEGEKQNWSTEHAMGMYERRMRLVKRRLAEAPFMAGDRFTAADISVTYALQFAERAGGVKPGEAEQAYLARTTSRPGYARAMDTCEATKGWVESLQAGATA